MWVEGKVETGERPGWLAKFTLAAQISQRDRLMAPGPRRGETEESKGGVPQEGKLHKCPKCPKGRCQLTLADAIVLSGHKVAMSKDTCFCKKYFTCSILGTGT